MPKDNQNKHPREKEKKEVNDLDKLKKDLKEHHDKKNLPDVIESAWKEALEEAKEKKEE